jgi:hypothetical protein
VPLGTQQLVVPAQPFAGLQKADNNQLMVSQLPFDGS